MAVILEILSGPSVGKKATVEAGQVLQVGRTEAANFVIRDDPMMSNAHFAIEWDGHNCRLRDLGSKFGTSVGGSKVTAAVLRDGDQFVAARTTFGIRIEGAAPAPIPAPEPPAQEPETATAVVAAPAVAKAAAATVSLEKVLQILGQQKEPLYALMDAARGAVVLAHLRNSKEEHQSLYEGPKGDRLAMAAPYLVRLPSQSPLLNTLVKEGWGKSWGVFLTSTLPFKEVRKHFRRFLDVKMPDGKVVYFRYYDPRVLRVFLPTCTQEEWRQFSGPVTHYFVEGDKPDVVLHFAADRTPQPKVLSVLG